MYAPIYVRPLSDAEHALSDAEHALSDAEHALSDAEHAQLEAACRARDALRVRRAQIVLASARGPSAQPIAHVLGCSVQTVGNAIGAFNAPGLPCLARKRTGPKQTSPALDAAKREQVRHILHLRHILDPSPRAYGKPTGVWTLSLAAQVCREQGLSEPVKSVETIRRALKALGVRWKRANNWITSPDPAYARKKTDATD